MSSNRKKPHEPKYQAKIKKFLLELYESFEMLY